MDFRVSRIGLAVVILVSVFAAGLFAYLVPRFGGPSVRFGDPYFVTARFNDSLGLEKSGDVWVRGVPVGKVEAIHVEGDTATVKLSIQEEHQPIHADATVRIGQKTPLGESYVELDPGTRRTRALPSDSVVQRTLPTVTPDLALRALNAETRGSINRLTANLQRGAEHPQTVDRVRKSLVGTSATISELRTISESLRAQNPDVSALVRAGATAISAIGARDRSLTRIVDGGSMTLRAVAEQSGALQTLMRRLAPTLTTTQRALAATRPLLGEARPALADLESASRALTPSFERVGPIARHATATLRGLNSFNDASIPLLRRALPLVEIASPTVQAATSVLSEVQPMLSYLEPRKDALAGFFSNMRASVSRGDAKGSWYRFNIFAEPETMLGLPGGIQRNAYTRPGDARANQPYRAGDFPRLKPYLP